MKLFIVLFGAGTLWAQTQVRAVVSQRNLNEQVNVVRLAPRYATAIKMPEAVSSVMVGDPEKFLAEHSEKEPALVLVKPVTEDHSESNLLITTVKGRQVSLVLRSEGAGTRPVDFVLTYKPVGSFLVEESGIGGIEVPKTEQLGRLTDGLAVRPVRLESTPATVRAEKAFEQDPLDRLLERQQRAELPTLYGMRTPAPEAKGDLVKAGISEVVDQGREVLVLFSVVNPQEHPVEILAPQIQLAGKVSKGFPIRRGRWGTSEQLPVKDFRLSRRRLGPGERADGVVLFDRPSFKQSNETLFLQIAESGAVDKPALAPIGFGVSALREAKHGE
jgi:hypothetical protein